MSDGSTKPVESGYTVSKPDMSSVGSKDVTVTYEGKTATFQITVAKPTDWADNVKSSFAANLDGYVPPFFYGPDMGVGTLSWTVTKSGVIYAEGDELDAADPGEPSPLKPFADILIADGFVVKTDPNDGKAAYYVLEKTLTVDGNTRYVRARLATCDAEGRFKLSGEFYIEFCDPYYYSWTDTGLEAKMASYFKFTEDIPDFPAGALFDKDSVDGALANIDYKMSYVELDILCTGDEALGYVNSFKSLDPAWTVLSSYDGYTVISPLEAIRIDGEYDTKDSVLTLKFSKVNEVPANVVEIANLMGVSKYLFEKNDDGSYIYGNYVELGDGQNSLSDLFDSYEGKLLAAGKHEHKGTKHVKAEDIYAHYFNEEAGQKITLETEIEKDKTSGKESYVLLIRIGEIVQISDEAAALAQVLGLDPYDVKKDSEYNELFFSYDAENYKDGYQSVINGLIAKLDADAALDNPVFGYKKTDKGVQGKTEKGVIFVDYVGGENNSRLARVYVYDTEEVDDNDTPDDKTDDVPILGIEIVFTVYNPAPDSEWAVNLATLFEVEFEWDNREKCYYFSDKIDLGTSTIKTRINEMASAIKKAKLGRDLSLEDESVQYGYAVLKMYTEEGWVEIQIWEVDDDKTTPDVDESCVKCAILVYFFKDPTISAFVNGISAALGIELDPVEGKPGYYACDKRKSAYYDSWVKANGTTFTYGYYMLTMLEGNGLLMATGLQFSLKRGNYGKKDSDYLGIFTNPDGYKVQITLYGDENGWTGYFDVIVVEPEDANADE